MNPTKTVMNPANFRFLKSACFAHSTTVGKVPYTRSSIWKIGMEKPRIYADFNKGTRDQGAFWLFLTQPRTFDDFGRFHLVPRVGLSLTFYMWEVDAAGQTVEIEAEGVIKYSLKHGWVAVIDESSIKHNPGGE